MNTVNFVRLFMSLKRKKHPSNKFIKNRGLLGIRIVQEYSRRVDILSEDMCYYLLEEIHTSLLPTEPRRMLTLLSSKSQLYHVIEYFENEPFTYSYLSQVYQGALRNGTDISIKIMDPKSKYTYLKELSALKSNVKFIKSFFPFLCKYMKIEEIVSLVEKNNREKLSCLAEISDTAALITLKNQYDEKYNLQDLHFPNLLKEYSSDDVLVGEFIYGTNVKQLLVDKKMKYASLLKIIRYHFFYIFVIGTFHSDLHSGNIILSDSGEIYFIDCNCLTVISEKFRVNFYNFFYYLMSENYEKSFLALKYLSSNEVSEKHEASIFSSMENIFHGIYTHNLLQINFSKNLMKFLKVCIVNGMVFDENLYQILKNIIRIEEMSSKTLGKAVFTKDIKGILEVYRSDIPDILVTDI